MTIETRRKSALSVPSNKARQGGERKRTTSAGHGGRTRFRVMPAAPTPPRFCSRICPRFCSRIKNRDRGAEGTARKRTGSSVGSQTRQVGMRVHWSDFRADGACTERPVRTTSLSRNGLFENHTLRCSGNSSPPGGTPREQPRLRTPARWSR